MVFWPFGMRTANGDLEIRLKRGEFFKNLFIMVSAPHTSSLIFLLAIEAPHSEHIHLS